jgi:hypothetical protein
MIGRCNSVRSHAVVNFPGFTGELAEHFVCCKYQNRLTEKMDDLAGVRFSRNVINDIVLWRVNRFVCLQESLLYQLEALRTPNTGLHRATRPDLESLLGEDAAGWSSTTITPLTGAVGLQGRATGGTGSCTNGLLKSFKLLNTAQRCWRCLDGTQLLPLLRAAITLVLGVEKAEKNLT